MGYSVAIVTDRDFSERLVALAARIHVWNCVSEIYVAFGLVTQRVGVVCASANSRFTGTEFNGFTEKHYDNSL